MCKAGEAGELEARETGDARALVPHVYRRHYPEEFKKETITSHFEFEFEINLGMEITLS